LSINPNVVFQPPVNERPSIKSSIIVFAHFWTINSLTTD